MKKTLLFLFLFVAGFSYSQTDGYRDYMQEIFTTRQPSPRAEAMGRGLAADVQNDFASWYNPALTSLGEGLKVNTSFSKGYFYVDEAFYNYFGASYKLKNIGSFALSNYHFNYGVDFLETTPYQPDGTAVYRIYYDVYTLNYSREIAKDFFAGVNINAVDNHNQSTVAVTAKNVVYTVDFGLLKKFSLPGFRNKNLSHGISVGTSIYNLTNTKYTFTSTAFGPEFPPSISDASLPVTFRGAVSYNFKDNGFFRGGWGFAFLGHFEYEKILNTDRYETYKLGSEMVFADILSLRAGWFSRKSNLTHSVYSYNLGDFSQFTYGAGLKIPLSMLFSKSVPVSLSVDYVNLKMAARPTTSVTQPDYGRFSTIAVSLGWIPGW